MDTLRSLEEALQEYTGCAVIVSHDRYFLDRLCTHMLVFGPGVRAPPWPALARPVCGTPRVFVGSRRTPRTRLQLPVCVCSGSGRARKRAQSAQRWLWAHARPSLVEFCGGLGPSASSRAVAV